jgi:ribosomal protein L7/L12
MAKAMTDRIPLYVIEGISQEKATEIALELEKVGAIAMVEPCFIACA